MLLRGMFMSPLSIAALAASLSVDAFAVSLGRGAALQRARFSEAVRTGLVFGVIEMLTPLIGWGAGTIVVDYVRAIDHWIAFVLLGAVGGHMILNALRHKDERNDTAPRNRSLILLLATAIGTSIDAMAVGVSLAFLNVNILVIAGAIGLTTLMMVTTGMMLGRLIGERFGRYAEIAGGLVLVTFGAYILITHTCLSDSLL